MKWTRMTALLLVVCMMLGLLAGCGGGSSGNGEGGSTFNGEPQYGGHLNVHIPRQIYGIDPVFRGQVWSYMYFCCIFENPLTRDAENNIAPGACDYELAEDGLSIKLWPREGLTFHDGTPVEAEDVKASIERACKLGNSVKKYLGPVIKEMTITDGVLTIEFTEKSEMAMSRLAAYQPWLAVIPKEVCEQYAKGEFPDMSAAIGTGPYKMTDYLYRSYITIERYDGYIKTGEGRTGDAGVKNAYLDSMTFWENRDYSSATMAMMSGDYDITDVIETEYQEMAEKEGIVRKNMGPSNTGFIMNFNNSGGQNLCAKYPDLRRAIMAAIDMEEFASVVTDGAVVLGGTPVVDKKYDTGFYEQTDWFGATNQDAVDKYLDAARAAGYKDEPIQIITSSTTTAYTLLSGYLDNAGVNYQMVFMDGASAEEFLTDPNKNWDLQYSYPSGAYTPTTLNDEYMLEFYVSEERDALLEELRALEVGSDAYMAKWKELHKLMVDDCTIVHFGLLDWYWNYREGLHCDYEGLHPYFYNAFWENPAEHPA